MKFKLLFLLAFCASAIIAQNRHLKNVERIINTKCIGSPSDRNTQKQKVNFKIINSDSVEIATETRKLASDSLARKNKFNFRISNIDAGNIVVKQFGSFYGVFIYTKERKKNISQSVFLSGDGEPSVFNQDFVCISDFENVSIANELKAELIKAIEFH